MKTKEKVKIEHRAYDISEGIAHRGNETRKIEYGKQQILKFAKEYADQETSSLREQLKEKDKEILTLQATVEDREYHANFLSMKRTDLQENSDQQLAQIQVINKELQSQSKLIESLAGGLKVGEDIRTVMNLIEQFVSSDNGLSVPSLQLIWNDLSTSVTKLDEALTEYNNYKNKQNGESDFQNG